MKGSFSKVDDPAQSFGRAPVIDAANNGFAVLKVGDFQESPEFKIPGRAGHLLVIKYFSVGCVLVDEGIFFAVPGADAEINGFKKRRFDFEGFKMPERHRGKISWEFLEHGNGLGRNEGGCDEHENA